MNKIKVIRAAGTDITSAIKASLGCSLTEFAEANGFDLSAVSGTINGSRTGYQSVITKLAEHLEVEREWLAEELAALRPAQGAA